MDRDVGAVVACDFHFSFQLLHQGFHQFDAHRVAGMGVEIGGEADAVVGDVQKDALL